MNAGDDVFMYEEPVPIGEIVAEILAELGRDPDLGDADHDEFEDHSDADPGL